MKLLLTSQGFYNNSIKQAFYSMLDKSVEETKIAFVVTSANGTSGDKRWLIEIMNQLVAMNFKTIDIIDFVGLPEDVWKPRMEKADVLFFSGGNSAHLMYEIIKHNFEPVLRELLTSRIYVGNSAGSIVASPNLALSNTEAWSYSPSREDKHGMKGMGLIDFLIRPHYNDPQHLSTEEDVIKMLEKNKVTELAYLIDDNTAIKVVDGEVEVISEGEWKVFNKK